MSKNRYIRQTILKDFGSGAQQKLADASVLVVGIGGLGIPVLQYLNAMGVGTLGMVEQDIVEITNLQRQVLYAEGDLGRPKLEVALEKLKAQNSNTHFKTYDTFLTRNNALEILTGFDIIVDASDNFATRYLVNDACVILKKPFVYGALHGFEGQVSVFNHKNGPTYRCLFPNMPTNAETPNCNDNGVLGVIPAIVGNLQALETVKVITGIGEVLCGKLLLFNGLDMSFQKIQLKAQPENRTIKQLRESYGSGACSDVPSINAEGLQQLIAVKKPVQIIDVRTVEEYVHHHLPNTINIPLEELENRWQEINMEEPVYLICQVGKRSKTALEQLQKIAKNTPLYNITGGIDTFMALCS